VLAGLQLLAKEERARQRKAKSEEVSRAKQRERAAKVHPFLMQPLQVCYIGHGVSPPPFGTGKSRRKWHARHSSLQR